MKRFFWTLPGNILDCFRGRMAFWHLAFVLLTAALVLSGIDWAWFASTRSPALRAWMFPAVRIGWHLPIVLPVLLLLIGFVGGNAKTVLAGWAIGQAEIIGGILAASYKTVTGRVHPPHGGDVDASHIFRFGILRGGVFWGWPSSHTTIAFAMAVTVFTLFPKRRWLGYVAIAYAFYVGVGVSLTIHWFSDFVAGAILGSVVGTVVGRSFLRANASADASP